MAKAEPPDHSILFMDLIRYPEPGIPCTAMGAATIYGGCALQMVHAAFSIWYALSMSGLPSTVRANRFSL